MEAASVRRGGPAGLVGAVRDVVGERSRVFWIVAGLTLTGAVLRFATVGLQSYHHDEVVTASRILSGDFFLAMNAVSYSESAPPLYYALAWLWAQPMGTDEAGLRSLSALFGAATIPVAFLIGAELRERRTGIFLAALVAANPMLLWYSQEARAYSLLVLLCSASLLFCLRALRNGGRRDFILWGIASGLALGTHYFAVFPVLVEAVALLWRRRRAALGGLAVLGGFALALAPLAYSQMSHGHAEWIGNTVLGHRLWETASTFVVGETADIVARPDRPLLALAPLVLCLAAAVLLGWRGDRAGRRAAALPAAVGAGSLAIPVLLAVAPGGKDFVLARNLIPALVPALAVIALATTLPSARRVGTVLASGLVAYSLAFSVWASASEELHRPGWDVVAERLGEPEGPRAMVTWTLGLATLKRDLGTDSFMARAAEGFHWQVREVVAISDGPAPPLPRRLLGARFRPAGSERADRLLIQRYAVRGPGLAPLRLRLLPTADLNFRTNAVLVDGIGPG